MTLVAGIFDMGRLFLICTIILDAKRSEDKQILVFVSLAVTFVDAVITQTNSFQLFSSQHILVLIVHNQVRVRNIQLLTEYLSYDDTIAKPLYYFKHHKHYETLQDSRKPFVNLL
jgi:hypothetical protein